MLKRLVISNYALIDSIELDLYEGLSIITGETGAGKSIILGALSLLLGQRADLKIIRNAEKKSVIEAVFDIENYALQDFFVANDIEYIPEECILRREIYPNGRSRAFINDTPVNLNLLSDLSQHLIDIHSQHSNALLLESGYQLEVLDNISGNKQIKEVYNASFKTYTAACRKLAETRKRIEANRRDEDFLRFQMRQFADLKLQEGEQTELEKELNVLSNISEIKSSLWEVCSCLSDGQNSVVSQLSTVGHRLDALADLYDESGGLSERIQSMLIEAKDIYDTVSRKVESLNDDPAELERVEERLNAIYSLQQKYHVNTLEELLEIQRGIEKSLSEIESSDNEIDELEKAVATEKIKMAKVADELSATRKQAAENFANKICEVARPLGLANIRCEIAFDKIPYDRNGQDKVAFLFAFNKNQQPMPIEKTASGGEISRLMLSIKTIIAESMQLPSIIFDEVDTGVSGEVANKIGEMMQRIGERIQVITITHLPQVAALGAHHYKVFKKDEEHTTVTHIEELNKDGRIREIAGMLSGSTIDDAAVNNAKSLLKYTV